MVKFLVLTSLILVSTGAAAFAAPFQNLFVSMVERSGMPANDVTVDQALQKVAVKMNQFLPSNVDKETRLEKLSAEVGQQLTYHYTLTTAKSAEVNKEKFKSAMAPVLKRRLCESKEMKSFLRNGVNIAYSYRAVDVHPVASFTFTPADCGYEK